MRLIRELQDIFDTFKKFLLSGAGAYLWLFSFDTYGFKVTGSLVIAALILLVIYMMERFEEILEDNDRLRVTQLAWIAETGGEEDAESSYD
jgi:uncharacterized membrane protein